MKKMVQGICKVFVSFLLILSLGTAVSADSGTILFREVMHNGPRVTQQGGVNSIVFNETQIDLSTMPEIIAREKEDVPDGDGFFVPKGPHGNIFHYTEITYNDGTEIIGHSSTLKISEIPNLNEVKSISFFYTYAGNVIVNRYLDEINDNNLLNTESTYGRVSSSIELLDGTTFSYDAEQLLVDKYEWGDGAEVNTSKLEFVSSDMDISAPINYVLDESIVINLIYKKVTPRIIGTTKIIFEKEDGTVLHTETLEGEIGKEFEISEKYFADKNEYELVLSPTEKSGFFTVQLQEYTFVYKEKETEEPTPETPDEETPDEETPDLDTNSKTESLPKTGKAITLFPLTLVGLGALLTLLKKKD